MTRLRREIDSLKVKVAEAERQSLLAQELRQERVRLSAFFPPHNCPLDGLMEIGSALCLQSFKTSVEFPTPFSCFQNSVQIHFTIVYTY